MPDALLDGLEENLPAELDLDGPSAPPRSNGALVFEEPWESRATDDDSTPLAKNTS